MEPVAARHDGGDARVDARRRVERLRVDEDAGHVGDAVERARLPLAQVQLGEDVADASPAAGWFGRGGGHGYCVCEDVTEPSMVMFVLGARTLTQRE